MLAQSFLTAEELEITEAQKDALCKTLVLLETGKLQHFDMNTISDDYFENEAAFSGHFNMATFGSNHECGTAACIAGTAELISGVQFVRECRSDELEELFYVTSIDIEMNAITPSQAATALRSYLTTGDARWDLAVSIG